MILPNRHNVSIRTKITFVVAVAAGSALLLACAVFVVRDIGSEKTSTAAHLSSMADVIGANVVAPLTFNDPDSAAETLASLRLEPIVRFACVYDGAGREFARYQRADIGQPIEAPAVREPGPSRQCGALLEVFAAVSDEEGMVGTLYLQADTTSTLSRVARYGAMSAGVLVVSLAVCLALAFRLQKVVSVPIIRLAELAKRISQQGDYSVRVEKTADDEIGVLCDEFNHMLAQIERGRRELMQAHDELESRVQERTLQLSQANEELVAEIAERKRAEKELRALRHQHIEIARRAGMAEIASTVLHNVGNVLNSVNISSNTITDKLRKLGISDLTRALGLVQEHLDNLGPFLTQDEQGRNLPRFLIQLGRHIAANEAAIRSEAQLMAKYVDHIKDIISVQQSHAGLSGIIENVNLAELMEDAIRINVASIERHRVEIVRQFEDLPPVALDRQKVLMIMVNLVSNAKYALIASAGDDKHMAVRIVRRGADRVRIEVEDNGVGIDAENASRIFSHGFTTRKEGHGFGLHSAALAAKELGGELTAHSDGPGLGATFALELPMTDGAAAPGPIEEK